MQTIYEVLGVSDKVRDLQSWFTGDLEVFEQRYDEFIKLMQLHGTPVGLGEGQL